MKKNTQLLIAAFAVIFVAGTIIALVLVENKDAFFWTSYGFSVIAIAGILLSSLKPGISNSKHFPAELSFTTLSAFYLVAVAIIIILFSAFIRITNGLYFAIHLGILAVFVAIFLFTAIGRNYIVAQGNAVKLQVADNKLLVADVQDILNSANDLPESVKVEAKKAIERVYEKVCYSDPMQNELLASHDQKIKDQVDVLNKKVLDMITARQEDMTDLNQSVNDLIHLIDDRNRRVKILK